MKTKIILLLSFVFILLSACSPSAEELVATYIAETHEAQYAAETAVVLAYTPTPTLTRTPTPVPSATITPTLPSTPTFTPTPIEPLGYAGDQSIIVYSGPGDDYNKIGEILPGHSVDLIGVGEEETWVIISMLGVDEGWVLITELDIVYDISKLEGFASPPVPIRSYTLTLSTTFDKSAPDWPEAPAGTRYDYRGVSCTIPELGIGNTRIENQHSVSWVFPEGKYRLKCNYLTESITFVDVTLDANTTVTFTNTGIIIYP